MKATLILACVLAVFSAASVAQTNVSFTEKDATVSSNNLDTIAQVNKTLVSDYRKRVHLVGCTSAAGTPDFNIALTEQRLNAVKRFLMNGGVAEVQIETFAMGEECDTSYPPSDASEYVSVMIDENSETR